MNKRKFLSVTAIGALALPMSATAAPRASAVAGIAAAFHALKQQDDLWAAFARAPWLLPYIAAVSCMTS